MPNRTLNQLRLEHAWRCAIDAKAELGEKYDGYTNAVKNLPAQITGNGLGEALAYLAANGRTKNGELKKPEGHLYRHVESWLTDRAELEDEDPPKGSYAERPRGEKDDARTRLIYRIARADSILYRRGISEALAYLSVLRSTAGAVKVGPFEASARADEGE